MWIRQSTAVVISLGPFVNPSDGVTLVTSLVSALDHASTGVFLSKNGGTLTIRHATVTASIYDAYGNYKVTLDTTDTNTLGILRVQFAAAASCLPVWQDLQVLPANIYDSLVSGSDLQDVSVTQILGAGVSTSTAQLGVNVVQAAGTAWGSSAITAASLATDAVAEIADGVWDEVLSGHLTAGTTGAALNGAGSAGDPWGTALPGAYGAGSAGNIIGNRLDAAVTTRLAPTVAARTLDVTATGEAGIDWGNIGAPTTTVTLTNTKINAITGNVEGNVNGSVLVAVGSVVGSVGSVNGNVGGNVLGNVNGSVGSVAGSMVGNVGGSVIGNVNGSVGSVAGSMVGNVGGSVLGNVSGSVALVVALGATAKADVNAEVVDALNVDTYAEPGQEAPPATASLVRKLGWLYKLARNRKTQSATTLSVFADNATTVDAKATISDSGTVYDHGELASGP